MSSHTPGRRAIRFSCRNCTTRLAAPLRAAGKKLRCPYCFTDLVVPQESTPAKRGEGYEVADPNSEAYLTTAEPAYITVVCGVCATRMYAARDQVGQTMTCPDCGFPTKVKEPQAAPAPETPRPATTEEYAVFRGEGQPPPESREVYQAYIPVVCPTCQTRMLATENEVGQELVCPDCQTRVRVPPLAVKAPAQPRRTAEEIEDTYDLGSDRSARGRQPAQILLVCSVCHTRLHAAPDQAGHEILCPDCYTPLVVPEDPGVQQPAVEAIDGYQVSTSAPPPLEVFIPGYEPVVDNGPLRRKKHPIEERLERKRREQELQPSKKWRKTQAPPLGPTFFSGVFHYPLYRHAWNRWVALSVGMFLVFALAKESYDLGGIRDPRTYFLSAMLLAGAGLTFLVWFVVATADMLEIIHGTAAGADEIEPGEQLWLDRVLECLFPIFAFGVATLLGSGVDRVLGGFGLGIPWVGPASLFFLFPPVLLSMVANGTPLGPIHLPVFYSMRSAWHAWALFYLLTFLLIAAVSALAWLLYQINVWLDALVLAVVQVWAIMVYSRLLGRLTWYCAQEKEEDEG